MTQEALRVGVGCKGVRQEGVGHVVLKNNRGLVWCAIGTSLRETNARCAQFLVLYECAIFSFSHCGLYTPLSHEHK